MAPAAAGHAVAFVWKSQVGRSGSIQPRKGRAVTDEIFKVLLVGLESGFASDLVRDEGLTVESSPDLGGVSSSDGYAAVVGQPNTGGAAAMVESIRAMLPNTAILIATPPGHQAEGPAALAAGAEDHLVSGELARGLLSIAIRYAIRTPRLRADLATRDPATGLPNMTGFRTLAEHHSPHGRKERNSGGVRLRQVRGADPGHGRRVRSRGLDGPGRRRSAHGGGSRRRCPGTHQSRHLLSPSGCLLLAGATGGVETMYDPADPRPLDEILGAAQSQLGVVASGP